MYPGKKCQMLRSPSNFSCHFCRGYSIFVQSLKNIIILGNTNCPSKGCGFQECVSWKTIEQKARNSGLENICMPFVAMSLYPDVQIPACHRHKDLKAMNEVFNAILDNATLFDCMKPLESTEFLGRALETFTEKRGTRSNH